MKKKKRILISVVDPALSDKFWQLIQYGWEIAATAETSEYLNNKKVPHTLITGTEKFTGLPEIMVVNLFNSQNVPVSYEEGNILKRARLQHAIIDARFTIPLCDPLDYSQIIIDSIYERVSDNQRFALQQKARKYVARYDKTIPPVEK